MSLDKDPPINFSLHCPGQNVGKILFHFIVADKRLAKYFFTSLSRTKGCQNTFLLHCRGQKVVKTFFHFIVPDKTLPKYFFTSLSLDKSPPINFSGHFPGK
ncbi:hypothetical protein D1614_21530 [Maribellus luteus]|uniref:Uncharacterized protein n=1 Tax=Maribellus luteus TaxID=2305463 RepID=A0A399STM3_9BACT|nr:hypothetical protein D1614_21530 [Maribellus luteus]